MWSVWCVPGDLCCIKKGPAFSPYLSRWACCVHVTSSLLWYKYLSMLLQVESCVRERLVWVLMLTIDILPLSIDTWPLWIDIRRFYLFLQCTNMMIICQTQVLTRYYVALYNRSFYHLISSWFYSRTLQVSPKEWSHSQNTSNSRDEEDPKPYDRTYRHPCDSSSSTFLASP